MTVRSGQNTYYTDIIAWGQGNNRIFNNVFYGEGKRSGISLNSVSNRICHNTFVGSASAIQFHSGKPGNQVLNNIVQDAARAFLVWPAKASPQTLDYNLYFNASATPRWERDGIAYLAFGAYQIAAGETHSRYENPRLTDATDARPRPASPAIDAGITLKAGLVPNEITVDLEGNPRPQGSAPDLGAYEHKLPASTPAPASKP
jgi:hypothetical protein